MHTLKLIFAGLLLLAAFCAIGWRFGGAVAATDAALWFVPVWLLAAIGNLWAGVARAGYAFREELSILPLVFGVPAAVAMLCRWWATM